MTLGENIKARRTSMNMTQKDLSSGICTQGQISKIEKNEIVPLANLLKNIADRLDISIDSLYGSQEDFSSIDKVELEKDLERYDFVRLESSLKNINRERITYKDSLYLSFLENIVRFEVHKEDTVENLISLVNDNPGLMSEAETARVLNSISVMMLDRQQFSEAEKYIEKAYAIIYMNKIDSILGVKVLNNYLRYLNASKQYKELYEKSLEAINYSFQNNFYNYISEAIYFKYLALEELELVKLMDKEELSFAKYMAKSQKKIVMTKKFDEFNKYI